MELERLDGFNPNESIGAFDGSGQWVELATVAEIRAALTHAKPSGSAVEAQREALKDAWSRFCDANPDDLTSPEELPDHALMTCEQFVEYALEALHSASEAQGCCITASAIEKAFSDPIEIWPTGWRETYPALAAPGARTIKTRLLALLAAGKDTL